MKRLLALFLAFSMVICFAACGNKEESTRKVAAKGQDTTTLKKEAASAGTEEQETGILKELEKTYAKSDKQGLKYDENVFLNLNDFAAGTVKIACAGDSITFGTMSSDPQKHSYPVYLQKLLDKNS